MIRLVVSDLDGTLLSTEKKPPRDLEEVLGEMEKRGVSFAVATGRDLQGGSGFFGDYRENMYFICDNGANVYKGGKLLSRRFIPGKKVGRITRFVEGIDRADCILVSGTTTYISRGHPAFQRKMESHYSPTTYAPDLGRVEDDIFKVSVFDSSGDIENHLYRPLKERFGDSLTIQMSRDIWVDIMDSSANKGKGVKYVQDLLGVSREETAAFGDYYNDLSLFSRAGTVYVMENGAEDLKKTFPGRAPSCDEGGVTKVIKRTILA